MTDDLGFSMPIDIEKSQKTQEMRIRGIASTPDTDRQSESVVQDGLDISEFVNYGYFNFDHDNSKILGYPDKERTKIEKSVFYVEGKLLDTPLSRRIWETAVALKKSQAPRKLGLSIEGKVLDRDPKGKILKAKVYNVAITSTPVNPNATWEALVKSMTADTGEALIRESLESATRFLRNAMQGDPTAMCSFKSLMKALNESETPAGIRAYLQIFKGYSDERLEQKTAEVLKELEDVKHGI